jgi:hypothetical protein
MRRRELRAAISAELLGFRVFGVTFRTLDGQVSSPILAWPQINREMDGKSIGDGGSLLDTDPRTEYHHSSYGRVRHPVMPLDFKNDPN